MMVFVPLDSSEWRSSRCRRTLVWFVQRETEPRERTRRAHRRRHTGESVLSSSRVSLRLFAWRRKSRFFNRENLYFSLNTLIESFRIEEVFQQIKLGFSFQCDVLSRYTDEGNVGRDLCYQVDVTLQVEEDAVAKNNDNNNNNGQTVKK